MEFNLNRLHDVHLNNVSGRGSGLTTAWAFNLAHLALMPDFDGQHIYILVKEWRNIARDYYPAIERATKHMGVSFDITCDGVFELNNTVFVFVGDDSPDVRAKLGASSMTVKEDCF